MGTEIDWFASPRETLTHTGVGESPARKAVENEAPSFTDTSSVLVFEDSHAPSERTRCRLTIGAIPGPASEVGAPASEIGGGEVVTRIGMIDSPSAVP